MQNILTFSQGSILGFGNRVYFFIFCILLLLYSLKNPTGVSLTQFLLSRVKVRKISRGQPQLRTRTTVGFLVHEHTLLGNKDLGYLLAISFNQAIGLVLFCHSIARLAPSNIQHTAGWALPLHGPLRTVNPQNAQGSKSHLCISHLLNS
jgi:hypothetical protein